MNTNITTNVETMTSSQLAEMLKFESKSSVNKAIRKVFDDSKLESFNKDLDSRGYVVEYHLPELESKMFVAKHDMDYLEMITQYWIERSKPKAMTTMEMVAASANAMVILEQRQKEQEFALEAKADKKDVTKLEERINSRGCKNGYMLITDARRTYGKGLSEEIFKCIMKAFDVPNEAMAINTKYGLEWSVQVETETMRKYVDKVIKEAIPVNTNGIYYTHPELGSRRFKI